MSFRHSMQRIKEYPRHHRQHLNFNLSHDDTGVLKRATMLPILYNDDAIVVADVDVNPMHASFAERTYGACAPESKVFSISASLQIDLTKGAIQTDKIEKLKIQIIPIAVAFEDIDPADDLSSLTIGAILELQDEDTTHNTYPIFNGTKIVPSAWQQVELGAAQLGLTTDTKLEYITFDPDQLFKMLSYGSNRGKLKSVIGGIITRTVQKNNFRTINMKINLPSKAKFMNKKTFFGLIIRIPKSGDEDNYGEAKDTTAIDHITINFRDHFLEWNHGFNHMRTG